MMILMMMTSVMVMVIRIITMIIMTNTTTKELDPLAQSSGFNLIPDLMTIIVLVAVQYFLV